MTPRPGTAGETAPDPLVSNPMDSGPAPPGQAGPGGRDSPDPSRLGPSHPGPGATDPGATGGSTPPAPAAVVLEATALARSFGGVAAVRDVSLAVRAGEVVAIIGPNGAGKSTCFAMLGGQLRPDRGEVRLLGRDITGAGPEAVFRAGVGHTFQVTASFASMTLRENVQLALLSHRGRLWRLTRALTRHDPRPAEALLDQVGLLDQADRAAAVLAYGDLKRLELALALANDPKLLLMDEPTAGMAPPERAALMAEVRALASRRGLAVLFTEHDLDTVFRVSDRILVLDRGAVIAAGTPNAIRADARVRAVYLGTEVAEGMGAEIVPGPRDAGPDATRQPPVAHPSNPSSIAIPPGAALREAGAAPEASRDAAAKAAPDVAPQATPGGDPAPVLRVQGLTAHYGRAQILHDLRFSVAPGEVLVLLGRNGAGKTTTLRAVMGLLRPSAGEVRFRGRDVAGEAPFRIARLGMGYVPEERRVFAGLSVEENLEAGRRPARPGLAPWTPERIFALFPNLGRMRRRPGGRMSGGEQQMLAVARTLMGNPSLVLLDEPSEGLAPIIVEAMAEAVLALKREGITVLLAEQNLRFAGAVADRAAILERGTLAWSGGMTALLTDEALRRRYLAV
ncbi:ATP-binding cassette domain-containing protein [Roseomonas elaeocarpi]|uniref:ATP-binding cassette domain-containing protein n=1 Tax=Roseomonas elaeocarpi TaxID=907779 RepID=A0ABV6JWN7_9PROT